LQIEDCGYKIYEHYQSQIAPQQIPPASGEGTGNPSQITPQQIPPEAGRQATTQQINSHITSSSFPAATYKVSIC